MKIVQVLCHNAIVAKKKDGQMFICMGKGIGFKKKPGELVDDSLVTQLYREVKDLESYL